MGERIEIYPQVHFGKPCASGTRIPDLDVLELVREGISFETIIRDYCPDLQMEDISVFVHYAVEVVQAVDIHILETG